MVGWVVVGCSGVEEPTRRSFSFLCSKLDFRFSFQMMHGLMKGGIGGRMRSMD